MANRFHVKLNTQRQNEATIALRYNYGFGSDEVEENIDPDYTGMIDTFRQNIVQYNSQLQRRVAERNPDLNVPVHIEYVQIQFQGQFVISDFYNHWFNEYGLQAFHFSKFNNEAIFLVSDQNRFNIFFDHVNRFIARESGENIDVEYNGSIKFIRSFKLLTTDDIIAATRIDPLMNFRLVDDFPLGGNDFEQIFASLSEYLNENQILFKYSEISKNLEIINASQQQILEIVRNYDIVLSVTSSLATVVRPTDFNLPERGYGFNIINADEDLPIIGIIDTGISNETPLAPIIINDDRFDLTSIGSMVDNVDHGTAVGALSALGRLPYLNGYRGPQQADAKLISIKVMDEQSGYVSQSEVVNLLKEVKESYPQIKIFVLTIGYKECKKDNEDYSTYAFELDKFAHENDCIICISIGNNLDASNENEAYNIGYFTRECTNLCSPAESMNNLIVGAAADSIKSGNFLGISPSKEYPALYTRKGHIDLSTLFPFNKQNKSYFKPDVIESGGDWEYNAQFRYIGTGLQASLEVLSSNRSISFDNQVGSSYSAPLVANIGAKIQKIYPDIRAQSIKALIINAASLDLINFEDNHQPLLNKMAGHGLTNEFKSKLSNDNSITMLIEESISPEEVKIFPINFPEYLVSNAITKSQGVLRITATLCFSFEPIQNIQLGYCPIHIGFGIFKNHTGDQILSSEKVISSLLKNNIRWTQTARHIAKPIPYTNTQKMTFTISKRDLENENFTFKLAVHCRINPQLIEGQANRYRQGHNFSIVLNLEENLTATNLTNRLYNEVLGCNSIEQIINSDLDAEAELNSN